MSEIEAKARELLKRFGLTDNETNEPFGDDLAIASAALRSERERALREAANICLHHHYTGHARHYILALIETPDV